LGVPQLIAALHGKSRGSGNKASIERETEVMRRPASRKRYFAFCLVLQTTLARTDPFAKPG